MEQYTIISLCQQDNHEQIRSLVESDDVPLESTLVILSYYGYLEFVKYLFETHKISKETMYASLYAACSGKKGIEVVKYIFETQKISNEAIERVLVECVYIQWEVIKYLWETKKISKTMIRHSGCGRRKVSEVIKFLYSTKN